MAVSVVADVVAQIAAQASAGIEAVVPVGEQLAGSLIVLSILALGLSVVMGGGFISPIVRVCLLAAGTLWGLRMWAPMIHETVDGAHHIVGLIAHTGYTGPADLFQLAEDTASRLVAEGNGASILSPSSIVSAFFLSIAAVIVWLGLSAVALMAALAEVELWLGAAMCPLILPFMALGATGSIGWGAINFVLRGSLSVVALGALSVFLSKAVTGIVTVGGTDMVLVVHQALELMALSFLSVLLALVGYMLASRIVGGSPLFSPHTVRDVVSLGQSAGSAIAAGIGGGAGIAAGAGARGAAGGGGPGSGGGNAGGMGARPTSPFGGGGSGGGAVSSVSVGSPFSGSLAASAPMRALPPPPLALPAPSTQE